MRIVPLFLALVLFPGSPAAAQIVGCLPTPHALPDDLQSTLQMRLASFVNAQGQGDWAEVEELFGTKHVVSQGSYRRCLIQRMQELRMVSFDISNPSFYACTTSNDVPGGTVERLTSEQLSWFVRGIARFQTSSETWLEEAQIHAYRDNGQWYFVPPQRAMQDKWEKIHYTEADYARDRGNEIEIRNSPVSPIEITALHAYMNREFPSIQNLRFTVRNKTSRKVLMLSIRIGMEASDGATEMAGPYEIKPKSAITLEQDDSAYGDFCQGLWKRYIVVTQVKFADGSKWKLK